MEFESTAPPEAEYDRSVALRIEAGTLNPQPAYSYARLMPSRYGARVPLFRWPTMRALDECLDLLYPPVRCDRGVPMNFANTKDESLLTFYESVRRQVEADRHEKYRFTGNSAKEYAERLREEMDRRKLRFKPIDWPL